MNKEICDKCDESRCEILVQDKLRKVMMVSLSKYTCRMAFYAMEEGFDYLLVKDDEGVFKVYEKGTTEVKDFNWDGIKDFVPDDRLKEACPYFMEHMVSSLSGDGK